MSLSFDVIFVGAGPASLAGALHLKRLARKTPGMGDLSVAVIEKAPNLGDQSLSGATFDPRALEELIPNYLELDPPFGPKVGKEKLLLLTRKHHLRSPFVPSKMSNKGKVLLSLAEFVRWLGKQAEKEGVEIYTGEAVDDLLLGERGITGVRLKGKGLDREGNPKPQAIPSTDVAAKVVVLGEGARGHLTKRLVTKLGLEIGATPQGYAIGIKELWEVDEKHFESGAIIDAMGYPVPRDTFGGGFVYNLNDRMVAVGMVVGLDYRNPRINPFELLQRFKAHPTIARILEGGRIVAYGAKTIAEGGWFARPRNYGDGFLIVGEAAGILDARKLKGIDHAMKSGMCAAETIVEAFKNDDFSERSLAPYEKKVNESWVGKDLWRARNFHQGFRHGLIPGIFHVGLQLIAFGRDIINRLKVQPDALCLKELAKTKERKGDPFAPDGKLTFDKLECVFESGTKHEEEQPCHICIDDVAICNDRCKREFGNPCQLFCPANVFEMVVDEDGVERLHLNPSNCLHCKACDVKDPYEIVTWLPPEGGGGPNYKGM